jgi:aminoglycoside 6-adenylyltransferase
MRSEVEMMGLILDAATGDDNVRAAVMNGSRVNPDARKDRFQDYDVVYYVRDVDGFKRDGGAPDRFGEIMIMQTPEDMGDPPPTGDGHYVYLMQFADGNRIDLSIVPVDDIGEVGEDSLTKVLVDKDGLIGILRAPSEKSYLPTKPNAKAFDDCCNEFWWVSPYVAKGLWREELTYAKHALDTYVRNQLMKMLSWYAGGTSNYEKSTGKAGKNLRSLIEPALYEELKSTYADAEFANIWDSLLAMGRLFRTTGRVVAAEHGFVYPEGEDAEVTAYLGRIRRSSNDRS